jgi:heme-degrading monooxygenase HmoA
MFVTVCIYRARQGEEDAIIALHENMQRSLRPGARGYLGGELLHDVEHPRSFLAVARYESEEAARALAQDPEQVAWHRRLVSLTEGKPTCSACYRVWHSVSGDS